MNRWRCFGADDGLVSNHKARTKGTRTVQRRRNPPIAQGSGRSRLAEGEFSRTRKLSDAERTAFCVSPLDSSQSRWHGSSLRLSACLPPTPQSSSLPVSFRGFTLLLRKCFPLSRAAEEPSVLLPLDRAASAAPGPESARLPLPVSMGLCL